MSDLKTPMPDQSLLRPSPEIFKLLEKSQARLGAPFYFYDLDGFEKHLTQICQSSMPWLKFWYASKANPMSAILKIVRNLGLGVDVASSGELEQALRAGVGPQHIIATGPAKSPKYLRNLLENEVSTIVCESLDQVYWLSQIALEMKLRPQVLLRLQLDWDAGESVLGGNRITPFGIDPQGWAQLDMKRTSGVDIIGMHVFQWGNILDLSTLQQIWQKIFSTVQNLCSTLNLDLRVLDLGGGLGIPYCATDISKRLQFSHVMEILQGLKNRYGVEELWMEIGRYAIGEWGHYFNPVVERKRVRGQEILVMEGGINHLARPALTGSPFPATLVRQSAAALERTHYQVHGPLCTALDQLGSYWLPSDIKPGDWLAFHQAGAYGMTESMPFFLCHPMPAEVIMYRQQLMTPRTLKTSADWMI
jgi:diaminopimelate decarboxylase